MNKGESQINNGRVKRETVTYRVPLTIPQDYYTYINKEFGEDEALRRTLIGLYKYVGASILRSIQSEINYNARNSSKTFKKYRQLCTQFIKSEDSREKNALKQTINTSLQGKKDKKEHRVIFQENLVKPYGKNPNMPLNRMRNIIGSSEKIHEISTRLVREAYVGQYQVLTSKLPQMKKILQKPEFLGHVNSFLTMNDVPVPLRNYCASVFKWKKSNVRPQLRGIRRNVERKHPLFPEELRCLDRDGQFVKLREHVDTFLAPFYEKYPQLNREIVLRILSKFQGAHVLHVLLQAPEKIHGIVPKIMKIKGVNYTTEEITRQVGILAQIFLENETTLKKVILSNIPHIFFPNPEEITDALTQVEKAHNTYLQTLIKKKYGTYYGKIKEKCIKKLKTSTDWYALLQSGIFSSEKISRGMMKLIKSMPDIRMDLRDTVQEIISTLLSMKYGEIIPSCLDLFEEHYCLTPPYHSKKNDKQYSPLDLAGINNNFLIKRPGKVANALLEEYLRKEQSVPLTIAPSKILEFFGCIDEGLTQKRLIDVLRSYLIDSYFEMQERKILILKRKSNTIAFSHKKREKYARKLSIKEKKIKTQMITRQKWVDRVIKKIHFNGITLKVRRFSKNIAKLSPLAQFLVNPRMEINIFQNKRIGKKEMLKVKEIIKHPDSRLHSLLIPPYPNTNNISYAHLTFSVPKGKSCVRSRTQFMNGITIPDSISKEEIIGIDVNKEGVHDLYVASDWKTTERILSDVKKFPELVGKTIHNQDCDKEYTAYVHDGLCSKRSSPMVNTLSRVMKENFAKLERQKKNVKKIHGAYSTYKLRAKSMMATFLTRLMREYAIKPSPHTVRNLTEFNNLCMTIKQTPLCKVHKLKALRKRRADSIKKFLAQVNNPSLQSQYEEIRALGHHIHTLRIEYERNQHAINETRKRAELYRAQIIALVICEQHPEKFAYEKLNVKHQGLKGSLSEITKYMPQMGELIGKVIDIISHFSEREKVTIDTIFCGINPHGTSGPPHQPSGRYFTRKKGQHHVVTIPKEITPSGVELPELKINTHILACQKTSEKARVL